MAEPNQHGVFVHDDCEEVILIASKTHTVKIYLAVDSDGKWRAAYNYLYHFKDNYGGSSSLPNICDKAYDTRDDALQEEIKQLSNRFPDYKYLWETTESIEMSLF
jgi:hypothetical protein